MRSGTVLTAAVALVVLMLGWWELRPKAEVRDAPLQPASAERLASAEDPSPKPAPRDLPKADTPQEPVRHGKPIRIIRRVKIPDRFDPYGVEVPFVLDSYRVYYLSSEAEFLRFVGSKNRRYLCWNNVDFSRQAVVVFRKEYGGSGSVPCIRSLERVGDGLQVLVIENVYEGPSCPMVSTIHDAVVIAKPAGVEKCGVVLEVRRRTESPIPHAGPERTDPSPAG
jgi:hypothetical protein